MKKIIAITAMAAAAAALSFADEPAVNQSVSLSGEAAVTWGVDLDDTAAGTFSSGFKNEASSTLKVVFTSEGTKATEGEGIWAEIKAKGTSLYAENCTFKDGKGSVEEAKLHFGGVYLGIKSGDTKVGDYKVPNAIMSADNDNALKLAGVGADATQGIVAGYGNSNFDFAVDFRSTPGGGTTTYTTVTGYMWVKPDGTIVITEKNEKPVDGAVALGTTSLPKGTSSEKDYYNNGYAMAVEAKLKEDNAFLKGLAVSVGYAMPFTQNPTLGIGANASYKLSLGDTFYLKPSVAYTMSARTGSSTSISNGLVGGVLFGWGDTADANAGVPYLDGDYAKKVTPGIGAALELTGLGTNAAGIKVIPSFYSGDLIPNLKVGAVAELGTTFTNNASFNFGVAGGVKYTLAVGDAIKISPYGGVRFVNGATSAVFTNKNTDNGGKNDLEKGTANNNQKLNIKAGVEFSGLINNTTFNAWYQSRNLVKDTNGDKAGTINIQCKIAL